jgi:hypothetical protein
MLVVSRSRCAVTFRLGCFGIGGVGQNSTCGVQWWGTKGAVDSAKAFHTGKVRYVSQCHAWSCCSFPRA